MSKISCIIILAILSCILIFPCTAFGEPSSDTTTWTPDSPLVKLYAEKYKVDPVVVLSLAQRMNYPDDVSVTIYLAKMANTNPMNFLDLRIGSKKWGEIISQYNLNTPWLFTKLKVTPAELPDLYRHAYQELAKHVKDPSYIMTLYDGEIRNLVQLKFCNEFLGMDPIKVINERAKGVTFTDIILKGIKK